VLDDRRDFRFETEHHGAIHVHPRFGGTTVDFYNAIADFNPALFFKAARVQSADHRRIHSTPSQRQMIVASSTARKMFITAPQRDQYLQASVAVVFPGSASVCPPTASISDICGNAT
jgi:hypothetical protein